MQKTKKEHYVPQCYLRNFATDSEGERKKICVFDKLDGQVRINQNILDCASERYFYDINIEKIFEEMNEEQRKKTTLELGDAISLFSGENEQFIEHFLANNIENEYDRLLEKIINTAHEAGPWRIQNCYAFSEKDKELMALFFIIQFLRTRKNREIVHEIFTKGQASLLTKLFNLDCESDDEKLKMGELEIGMSKQQLKIEHARQMFDIESIVKLVNVIMKHTWTLFVNRTSIPFYTSDAPIALWAQKYDRYRSYKGLGAEGIFIAVPICSDLLIGMQENTYMKNEIGYDISSMDRDFCEITDIKIVTELNMIQVTESYRNVYCCSDSFDQAKKYCACHEEVKHKNGYISVG